MHAPALMLVNSQRLRRLPAPPAVYVIGFTTARGKIVELSVVAISSPI
jgi:hypothetical protein